MARTARIHPEGALALVTGAGSGIGRATALALAARRATVLCVDIRADAAEKAAADCELAGAAAAGAYAVDVADRPAMDALADRVHADHGPVGILVNNAGVGMSGSFADMTADDWSWIRGVNLDGVVHGCAAFGPAMLGAGRGHVVNVSSGLGFIATANEGAYGTTKAAVLALSLRLRADWARQGVGVSAVCPGVIATPILESTRFLGFQLDDPEFQGKMVRLFRRGHRPEKVAAAILDAVARDRVMVPVGVEAWVGWYVHRLAPLALQQVLARGGRR
jgi:2-hydroxycyclohexanecarboxyl-CoA dehydrogenase